MNYYLNKLFLKGISLSFLIVFPLLGETVNDHPSTPKHTTAPSERFSLLDVSLDLANSSTIELLSYSAALSSTEILLDRAPKNPQILDEVIANKVLSENLDYADLLYARSSCCADSCCEETCCEEANTCTSECGECANETCCCCCDQFLAGGGGGIGVGIGGGGIGGYGVTGGIGGGGTGTGTDSNGNGTDTNGNGTDTNGNGTGTTGTTTTGTDNNGVLVPEPSTYFLLSAALLFSVYLQRRRLARAKARKRRK